jgi:hypothetical protein
MCSFSAQSPSSSALQASVTRDNSSKDSTNEPLAIGRRLGTTSAALEIDGLPAVGMLGGVACPSARKVEDEFVDWVAASESAVEVGFVVGAGFEVYGAIFYVEVLDEGFWDCGGGGDGGECWE